MSVHGIEHKFGLFLGHEQTLLPEKSKMAVANVNQGFQQQFFTVIMFLNELDEMDDAIIQSMLDTEEDERLRMMLYRFRSGEFVVKCGSSN